MWMTLQQEYSPTTATAANKILVVDFGGQYAQLIARRVRECRVYAEILPYQEATPEAVAGYGCGGLIFTGGPASVYAEDAPRCAPELLKLGIPVLGICYGAQLLAYLLGGTVGSAGASSEYGRTEVTMERSPLFSGLPAKSVCWMSHTDYVMQAPEGFVITAYTDKCPAAALEKEEERLYAVQFHPEVTHTEYGRKILENFLYRICGLTADWQMEDFVARSLETYRESLAGSKVLLALSGGVDSSVAALLLHKAIGQDLTCVFVDHGLLRKGEGDLVEQTFRGTFGVNLIRVNAQERFLNRLAGVSDPESKRRIIGEEFIRVFEDIAGELSGIHVLAQGTIYPDVIESGKGASATIKSHHNVGGLPSVMTFDRIVEPLRDLFKDEVREAGRHLGLPPELLYRQPFPGPGLAVRVAGEVTAEKLTLLREADAVFREEVDDLPRGKRPAQYFAVLLPVKSVGVMGDERTYGYTIALRAVSTEDFMTAGVTRLPYDVLEKASTRIVNEVRGISRVLYDVTSKPPATVEWE